MKTFAFILSVIVIFCIATNFTDPNVTLKHEIENLKAFVGPPPASLNKYYPPAADGPVYKIKMFSLAAPLTAIGIALQEGNLDEALDHFGKFNEEYTKISKMVPEWEKNYPSEPIGQLEAALKSNDVGTAFMAISNVGKICSDCHIANMAKVQQQFHWEDFSEIRITDPVTNMETEYSQFMMFLEIAFSGAGLKLEQRQVDNALKYLDVFNARFQTLKESCTVCHDTERKYYVDDNIQKMIDELRFVIENPTPDMTKVGNLFQKIGNESCIKCHLVHIPAAYAKNQWKMQQLSLQN